MKNETTRTTTASLTNYSLNTRDFNFSQGFSAFSFLSLPTPAFEKLNELKTQLTSQLTAESAGALSAHTVRLAVNEADSLAATTPFPALFLPALAEEKVHNALAWRVRQQAIREQTLALAA